MTGLLNKTVGLVFSLLFAGALYAGAAPLPEWVRKGESYMNGKRVNTSYAFKVFKTEDASATRLHEGRFYPLFRYLGEAYGADPDTMVLDSLSSGVGEPYYQLYAVSEPDAPVVFDQFERSERSKGTAALLNIALPGVGQLYKGHTFKGWAILGSEIALGVTAITQQVKANYYDKMAQTATAGADSFRSDALGRRKIRNVALGAMAGIWAFGLYDALAADSMPNIVISAPEGRSITFAPASSSAGIALVYRF